MTDCFVGGEDLILERELLEQLADLEADTYGSPWTAEMIEDMMRYDHNILFVEREDGELRGYLFANLLMEQSELLRITVSPTYRRQGVGERLWLTYMDELKGICTSSILEVRDSNVPARSFYENFGYEEISRRKDYYTNPTEDAVIYLKEV